MQCLTPKTEVLEKGPEALVRITVPDGQAPGSFPEGSYVEFSDVEGMDGLMTHKEKAPNGDDVQASCLAYAQ